jgi:hypothetical protein
MLLRRSRSKEWILISRNIWTFKSLFCTWKNRKAKKVVFKKSALIKNFLKSNFIQKKKKSVFVVWGFNLTTTFIFVHLRS